VLFNQGSKCTEPRGDIVHYCHVVVVFVVVVVVVAAAALVVVVVEKDIHEDGFWWARVMYNLQAFLTPV